MKSPSLLTSRSLGGEEITDNNGHMIKLDEDLEDHNAVNLDASFKRSHSNNSLKSQFNLPKTFTTRKGALMLFAKENALDDGYETARNNVETDSQNANMTNNNSQTSNHDNMNEYEIKTLNDLQKNVLLYGIEKRHIGNRTNLKSGKRMGQLGVLHDFDIFSLLTKSTKNLINSEIEEKLEENNNNNNNDGTKIKNEKHAVEYENANNNDKSKLSFKRINRGYSARRYLRNLTKNWDQNLLDSFIMDGKLTEDTIYERDVKSSKKKRLEDDLSLRPQAYRFDKSWINPTVDMRSYKFMKAQDFALTDHLSFISPSPISKQASNLHIIEPTLTENDPIKVIDPTENKEVEYDKLSDLEKQKVLSELLYQSALNNIQYSKNVEYYNEKLNYFNETTKKKMEPVENVEVHIKNFPDEIIAQSDQLSTTENEPLSERNKLSRLSAKSQMEPIYMFGRHSGASWVVNKKSSESDSRSEPTSIPKSGLKMISPQFSKENSLNSATMLDSKSFPASGRRNEMRMMPKSKPFERAFEKSNINDTFMINDKKTTNDQVINESLNPNTLANNSFENMTKYDEFLMKENIVNLDNNSDNKILSVMNNLDDDEELTHINAEMEEIESIEDEFALEEQDGNIIIEDQILIDKNDSESYKNNLELVEDELNKHSDRDEYAIEEQQVQKRVQLEKPRINLRVDKTGQHKTLVKKQKRTKKQFKEKGKVDDSHHANGKTLIDANYAEHKQKLDVDKFVQAKMNEVLYRDDPLLDAKEKLIDPTTSLTSPSGLKQHPTATNSPMGLAGRLSPMKHKIEHSHRAPVAKDAKQQPIILPSLVDKQPVAPNYINNSDNVTNINVNNTIMTKIVKQKTVEEPLESGFVRLKDLMPGVKDQKNATVYVDDEHGRVELTKLKTKSDKVESNLDPAKTANVANKILHQSQTLPSMLNKLPEIKTDFKLENLFKENKKLTDVKKQTNVMTIFNDDVDNYIGENFPARGLKADKQTQPPDSTFKQTKPSKSNDSFKRTVDWSSGPFDPREFFLSWSYETPPAPILVDKTFADTLKRYAEFIARYVLSNKYSGKSLSDDIQKALRLNLEKLKEDIERGKVSRKMMDEYKKIFRQILAKTMKRKDLENVEIDDDMLLQLLEYPAFAFEIYKDEQTGQEKLRVKSAYLKERAKLIRNVVTEKALSMDDFDVYIDPITGERKLRFKPDVARRLGLPEGCEDLIEIYVDENGNTMLRLKGGARTITIGNTTYELVIDPKTGRQILKMTTKQKVGEETFEDILRLAENMTPESRHRYFQELLKTSGEKMSDELRRKLIEEMMKNALNLDENEKEKFLKDLMVNLVNVLPSDLAKKVLNDILKSTDKFDPSLKEKMLQNLINDMNDLPDELKQETLKMIIKNMDNLSSDVKHKLLKDILDQVEAAGGGNGITGLDKELRNQVLKEMLKNSQNMDEETRNKIIKEVLDKITADGEDGVPSVVLEELVKQMYNLPDDIKSKILDEVNKSLEKGNLDSKVLAELLKNPENLSAELLAAIVKNSDKMDTSTLKELVKNLDKLPDDLKNEMLNKMANNLDDMDPTIKQEFLKELLANPNLIKDEALRDKLIKNIMNNLSVDDILKETENMTAEEKNKYLQDLLKRAGDLSDEAREKIIGMLIKNAENLDENTRNNLLKDLVDVVKDLPKDLAAKVLGEIMKNTENLDSSLKQKMIQNLLDNMNDLPDELKQQALQEIIKNLDDLSADKKEEIMKNILNNVDNLPPELRDKTLKTILDNMGNLSSQVKNQLLQDILSKVEDGAGGDSEFSKQLKNELIKEIIKNSKNLDDDQRAKILKDVLDKLKPGEGDGVADIIMEELVKQMDSLPDSIRDKVLDELKKTIDKGNIGAGVLNELLKNAKNLPPDLLKKVVDNMNNLAPDALQQLVKNLDKLPDDLKNKAVKHMINNIDKLDPSVQNELLNELLKNPNLVKDKKMFESAINNIVENLDKMPENVRRDMLKNLAKNINNLTGDFKEKVIKEVLNNLSNTNDETREEILKQLARKMGHQELEEWIKNSDLSEEMKQKMLKDLENIKNNEENLLDSDDERELEGLTGEQRRIKKRQLIEKKKQEILEQDDSKKQQNLIKQPKRDLDWLKNNTENILANLDIQSSGEFINLTSEQIDFLKAFGKLSEEEKAKLLQSMTKEQREQFMKLEDEYARLRQKELEDALNEAKRLALQKLREQLEYERRLAFMRSVRYETDLFSYNQQISRAYVFSYYEMFEWLDSDSNVIEATA